MNKDVFSRLLPQAKTVINKLKKQGWIFEDGGYEDYHTGVPYDKITFKSPNMEKFAVINESRLGEITEDYLLKRDAWHSAHDWADCVFNHVQVITNPLAEGLEKYFLKNKSSDLKKLYSTSAQFEVSISPKVKNLPTKIKVKIEVI